jgi:hypothetical protein
LQDGFQLARRPARRALHKGLKVLGYCRTEFILGLDRGRGKGGASEGLGLLGFLGDAFLQINEDDKYKLLKGLECNLKVKLHENKMS